MPPTRNQMEFAALVFMTGWVATGIGMLIYERATPGADGKPRPKIRLDDPMFSFPKSGPEKKE